MLKKMFKNQRGLTLIELLAVIVILGIIAAIAIPAIGGMISNSKKDAHIANAEQMANAARINIAANKLEVTNTISQTLKLSDLVSGGQIEDIKNPSGKLYDDDASKVVISRATANGPLLFTVTLKQATGEGTSVIYINAKEVKSLTRELVENV